MIKLGIPWYPAFFPPMNQVPDEMQVRVSVFPFPSGLGQKKYYPYVI